MTTPLDHLPPHSPEAEAALCGAIILNSAVMDDVKEIIASPDEFYSHRCAKVYAAVDHLHARGQRVDMVTLNQVLADRGQLDSIGGVDFLVVLMESVPSAASAIHYATIVHEKAMLRRLIESGEAIAERARRGGEDAAQQLDLAQREVFDLGVSAGGRDAILPIQGLMAEVLADTERRAESGETPGLKTGFFEIDDMTGGMQGGHVWIIAARPSMGKTAWAINIAENVAAEGTPVLCFSLEMSPKGLAARVLTSRANVPSNVLRHPGNATADDWQAMTAAVQVAEALPLYVADTPGVTLDRIRSMARRAVARQGVGLVVIDYLGLIAREPGMSTNDAVGRNSRGIKTLARELGVPVILLAQLNRGVESREIKTPGLADLRDSGEIEQDADAVLFIHRPDYYARQKDPSHVADHRAYISVAKQREGPTGNVLLHFDAQRTRFKDWEGPKPF